MFMIIPMGTLLKKRHKQRMFSLATRSYLSYKREVNYGRFNEAIKSTSRATTDPKGRVHLWVTESKHNAYTTNTTSIKELSRLKYSKELQTGRTIITMLLTWIISWILEKSHKQAPMELDSVGTSHRGDTDKLATPPNSSFTLSLYF
jgi:hypothetical protein